MDPSLTTTTSRPSAELDPAPSSGTPDITLTVPSPLEDSNRPPTPSPVAPGEDSSPHPLHTPGASSPATWEFDLFDLFTLETNGRITRRTDSDSPALDLMEHGYVAKTPERPQVAVSVRTLQLLHRLHNRKPSFSIEAFAKVVCDYYSVRQYHLYMYYGRN